MASQKQTEANRLNAQKSTGPRSAAGKARSSQNALKSGIDAQSQIIRGEKIANLEILQAEYHARFRPSTPEQRMLVDTLVDSEWLLRRFRTVESQLWEESAGSLCQPAYEFILGQSYNRNYKELDRLQRRIDTAHRHHRNALEQLRRLQAEEILQEPEPEPEQTQPPKAPNGFVPQAAPPIAEPERETPEAEAARDLEPSPIAR